MNRSTAANMPLTPTQQRALAELEEYGYVGMRNGFREATFRALEREGLCEVQVTNHPAYRYADAFGWNTARGYREWLAVLPNGRLGARVLRNPS